AEPDGSLLLPATAAEIYGATLVFEPQYRNLGYWSSADDHAIWTVQVPKAGKYEVWIDYACDNGNAGTSFAIDADAGSVTATVAGTGNWDTYRKIKIGTLTLAAGDQRLTMRPAAPIKGAMIDLR